MTIKHTNFHPEICRILDMLEDLKEKSQLNANTIASPFYAQETEHQADVRRTKAQATADAYAFCMLLLRNALIKRD